MSWQVAEQVGLAVLSCGPLPSVLWQMGKSLEVEVALPSLLAHTVWPQPQGQLRLQGILGARGVAALLRGTAKGRVGQAAELQLLGPGLAALSPATPALPPPPPAGFGAYTNHRNYRPAQRVQVAAPHLIPCLGKNHILLGPWAAPPPSPQPPVLQVALRSQAGAMEEVEAGGGGTTPEAVGAGQLGPACPAIWQIC